MSGSDARSPARSGLTTLGLTLRRETDVLAALEQRLLSDVRQTIADLRRKQEVEFGEMVEQLARVNYFEAVQ